MTQLDPKTTAWMRAGAFGEGDARSTQTAARHAMSAARCAMHCSAVDVNDVDIATPLAPDEIMRLLEAAGIRRRADRNRARHGHRRLERPSVTK